MANPSPVAPADLTDAIVRAHLKGVRGNRVDEYLCRAYLQFGPDGMADADLLRLSDAINARKVKP